MSYLKALKNGHFFIYEMGEISAYGRSQPTGVLGTTSHNCRHATANEFSRMFPEVGERGGKEILCEPTCPVKVNDVILLYDRSGTSLGDFRVLALDEGESLTGSVAKRFFATFNIGLSGPAD